MVDTHVIHQHLVLKVIRVIAAHVTADRDIHNQVHRVIKRPVVVGRVGALAVDQMRVFGVTINTDPDLLGGPPHLVGVPLVYRAVEVSPIHKLSVRVRGLLVSGTLKMERARDMIVRII